MNDVRRRSTPLVLFVVVASLACTVRPKATDTGYAGTWSRGNGVTYSVVAIVKQGGGYLFRWSKRATGGDLEIRCDWGGRCEETFRGRLAATYDFKTRMDPSAGRLIVECLERRLEPEKRDIHYVDELVVEPGGKVLWSYTIERDGKKLEGMNRPMRSFNKVADAIAGVPPAATR